MADLVHDTAFLDEMRRELVERRDGLIENIRGSQRRLSGGESRHLADVEDLASDAADEIATYEILAIGHRGLEQIEHALRAIEDGTYGVCEDTGDPIGIERLRALPFATLSVEAKRRREAEAEEDYPG